MTVLCGVAVALIAARPDVTLTGIRQRLLVEKEISVGHGTIRRVYSLDDDSNLHLRSEKSRGGFAATPDPEPNVRFPCSAA
jgi:hypothetical protein